MIFEKWISLVPGSKFTQFVLDKLRNQEDHEFTIQTRQGEKFKVVQRKTDKDQFGIDCYQLIELPDETKLNLPTKEKS